MFSSDWMILTIIGLTAFLMWHIMIDSNPLVHDAVTVVLPDQNNQNNQNKQPLKKPLVEKAQTIFAEPGLGGMIVDPLSTTRVVPEESTASTTIGMPL